MLIIFVVPPPDEANGAQQGKRDGCEVQYATIEPAGAFIAQPRCCLGADCAALRPCPVCQRHEQHKEQYYQQVLFHNAKVWKYRYS